MYKTNEEWCKKIKKITSYDRTLITTFTMSLPSFNSQVSEKIAVRFYNFSNVEADVIWINYQGDQEKYCTLRPKQFIDVNTYSRHYWIFIEKNTNRALMANNQPYFLAEDQKYEKYPYRTRPTRFCVGITKALVPTLKGLAISYLSRSLRSCGDVKHLEIPKTLKREIIVKIHGKNNSSHSDSRYVR